MIDRTRRRKTKSDRAEANAAVRLDEHPTLLVFVCRVTSARRGPQADSLPWTRATTS